MNAKCSNWRLPFALVWVAGVLSLQAAVSLRWSEPFCLPPDAEAKVSFGVARPYAGENNGVVLLAGGANFPDAPLTEGGRKRYHATIYGSPVGSQEWRVVGVLPQPMGEGASATTPAGIVGVGGCTGEFGEDVSSQAFLMTWEGSAQRPVIRSLPDFPYPVKMSALAARGNRVYLVGGWQAQASVSDVWMLDLDRWLGGSKAEWQPLPRLPVGREQPVAAIQNTSQQRTALFVVGGMADHRAGPQVALEAPFRTRDEKTGKGGIRRGKTRRRKGLGWIGGREKAGSEVEKKAGTGRGI